MTLEKSNVEATNKLFAEELGLVMEVNASNVGAVRGLQIYFIFCC